MADLDPRLTELRAVAQAGDLARAARLAEALIADSSLREPLPFRVLGAAREAQGRLAEAAQALLGALRLDDRHVPTLTAYGQVRARLGQLDEAQAALQRAVALDGHDAGAQFALGWTLENRGEVDAALVAYGHAAAREPRHASAHAHAAALSARRARWAAARSHAEAALAIDGGSAVAQIALAQADLGEQQPARAEARLRALLAAAPSGLSAQTAAVARSALGDSLHAQAQPAPAFAAWQDANMALRQLHAARFAPGAGSERGLALAARLTAAYAPGQRRPWPAQPAPTGMPAGLPAAGHAFIVGFPRSGTTLLGQVLGSHPAITTLDEVELLSAAAGDLLGSEAGLAALDAGDPALLARYRADYWRAVEARLGALAGQVFIDKLPTYLLGLPLLARLFPQARVIVVRRDPRDVLLSCFRHLFVINPSTWEFLDLFDAARFFDATQRLAEHWLATLPISGQIVRHEDLVDDFDGTTRHLCAFLGLDWDAATRDFAAASATRAVRTVSSGQVSRGLYRDGAGQWRAYREQLAPVLPLLAPWVAAWGYPAD